MISPVRVDLFLSLKASEAAFRSKADPAMHPNTVGFLELIFVNSPSGPKISLRAQDTNTATLQYHRGRFQYKDFQPLNII